MLIRDISFGTEFADGATALSYMNETVAGVPACFPDGAPRDKVPAEYLQTTAPAFSRFGAVMHDIEDVGTFDSSVYQFDNFYQRSQWQTGIGLLTDYAKALPAGFPPQGFYGVAPHFLECGRVSVTGKQWQYAEKFSFYDDFARALAPLMSVVEVAYPSLYCDAMYDEFGIEKARAMFAIGADLAVNCLQYYYRGICIEPVIDVRDLAWQLRTLRKYRLPVCVWSFNPLTAEQKRIIEIYS